MTNTKDFLMGVVIGSAVGAVTALMYAPRSGTESRQILKDRAGEAMDKTTELTQQARERASGLVQQTQSTISDLKGQAESRISDLGHRAQGILNRGRETMETQREAMQSAVEAGREAYQERQAELHHEVEEDTLPASTTNTMRSEPV